MECDLNCLSIEAPSINFYQTLGVMHKRKLSGVESSLNITKLSTRSLKHFLSHHQKFTFHYNPDSLSNDSDRLPEHTCLSHMIHTLRSRVTIIHIAA